jgi:SAM-dependent methyltransferase
LRDASGVLAGARTSLRNRALDVADRVRGRSDPLVPPRRLNFVGPGDFVSIGDEFLRHFVELGGLRPGERVLDIGCGIGRMARPLAGYLGTGSSYDGFDVSREGIEWCRRHYRGLPAGFVFAHADIANALYNPSGTMRASDYRFPYEAASFDFALAISVFTHLVEADTANYVAEAARVLAPGGRLFSTWLLLDDDVRERVAAGDAAFDLTARDDVTFVMSSGTAEEAVAFDRGWVKRELEANGLEVGSVWPGTWPGCSEGRSFQDIVVGTKR